MFNLKNGIFLFVNLLLVLNLSTVNGTESISVEPIDDTYVSSKFQNLRNRLYQSFDIDPVILNMFDEMTMDWQEYHQKSQAFRILTLVKAADLLINKEIERYQKDGKTALPHVIRITHILWNDGQIRSVNVLASALLDHIDEVGVTNEDLRSSFGSRIYATLQEDHPPTQTEEEHRQAHLDIAPDQSINAQMIHLAHRIEHLRYRLDLNQMTHEQILIHYHWNRKLLEALHGANENLENTLNAEIRTKFRKKYK